MTDQLAADERLAALAGRLADHPDPLDQESLAVLLTGLGWKPAPWRRHRFFQGDGLIAWARDRQIEVELADFGAVDDLDYDDFDDAEPYEAARDQLYVDAAKAAARTAGALDLPPAGPFDADELRYSPDRIRSRSGHWVVSLGTVNDGSDLPIVAVADFTWGADLPGRLTALIPPPIEPPVIDWSTTSRPLPADYRWLMDTYGPITLGGYLTLLSPDEIPAPIRGSRFITDPHPFVDRLPAGSTATGDTVSWVMHESMSWDSEESQNPPDEWTLELSRPGHRATSDVGLLRHLVLELLESGNPPRPSDGRRRVPMNDDQARLTDG